MPRGEVTPSRALSGVSTTQNTKSSWQPEAVDQLPLPPPQRPALLQPQGGACGPQSPDIVHVLAVQSEQAVVVWAVF